MGRHRSDHVDREGTGPACDPRKYKEGQFIGDEGKAKGRHQSKPELPGLQDHLRDDQGQNAAQSNRHTPPYREEGLRITVQGKAKDLIDAPAEQERQEGRAARHGRRRQGRDGHKRHGAGDQGRA